MHYPLSHPPPADCVAPAHNAPHGTSCSSIFRIGCALRDFYASGPNRCFLQIPKHLIQILETIRHISVVCCPILSPLRFSFSNNSGFRSSKFIYRHAQYRLFFGRVFNILTECFCGLHAFTGVLIEFFRRIFSFLADNYSVLTHFTVVLIFFSRQIPEGELFGLITFYGRSNRFFPLDSARFAIF